MSQHVHKWTFWFLKLRKRIYWLNCRLFIVWIYLPNLVLRFQNKFFRLLWTKRIVIFIFGSSPTYLLRTWRQILRSLNLNFSIRNYMNLFLFFFLNLTLTVLFILAFYPSTLLGWSHLFINPVLNFAKVSIIVGRNTVFTFTSFVTDRTD
jgi:hypothetical protein